MHLKIKGNKIRNYHNLYENITFTFNKNSIFQFLMVALKKLRKMGLTPFIIKTIYPQ